MNFLEAFEELDILFSELEENYNQATIPWPFTCWNTGGVCPGCGEIHDKNKAAYSTHLTNCAKFGDLMSKLPQEAIIKNGKEGHSFDHMQNISADDLKSYLTNNSACEICGRTIKCHPDHDHSTLKFRGALCTNCNMNLGWFEQNKANIKSYLSGFQQWKKLHNFKKPILGYKKVDLLQRKLLSDKIYNLIQQERAKNKPNLANTSHNKK
jgi:hypothetical protein